MNDANARFYRELTDEVWARYKTHCRAGFEENNAKAH